MENLSTSEKILKSASVLFSQKGYDAVTTKAIARKAGVSEMTLFRHFENKLNLFEKAFEEYVFFPKFKILFENNIEWDLERDLFKISNAYQDMLAKNEKIILMHLKDKKLTSEFDSPMFKFPNELKNLLVKYFLKMKEIDIVKENPEVLAVNFLAANFGIYVSFLILNKFNTDINIETCVLNYVKTFAKGITS